MYLSERANVVQKRSSAFVVIEIEKMWFNQLMAIEYYEKGNEVSFRIGGIGLLQ